MNYYHLKIKYKDPKTKYEFYDYELDLSEEDAKSFAEQYEKGELVFFKGKWIDSSSIAEIEIQETEKKSTDFYPNLTYSMIFYGTRAHKIVTRKFIKSPPKRREISREKEKPKQTLSRNIFIVHGRDEKQALRLQKYLKDKLKVDAVMFDDLPDKGRTIIEQLEYIRDNVGYAFVIVTPDDVGCLTKDIEEFGKMVAGLESVKAQTIGKMFELFHTRARQNVVFELGLFMGALGRKKVCCLLKQDTEERPSDIDGILYKPFNKSVSEIFHEIPEELTEADYEINVRNAEKL